MFNVISFGSEYSSFFEESVAYNDHTLSYVSEKLSKLKANMGGTEILEPLQFIMN
jgi:hypothetical protein